MSAASYSNELETSVEDLLIPEISSVQMSLGENDQTSEMPKDGINIDELLGPVDNFPFLSDNHRDSGTGKFNSF